MWGKNYWNQFRDGAFSSSGAYLPNVRKITNLALSQEPVLLETYQIFRCIRQPSDKLRYKYIGCIRRLLNSCMFFLQELHLLHVNAHFFSNIDAIFLLFSDLRINAPFAISLPN